MRKSVGLFMVGGIFTVLGCIFGFAGERQYTIEETDKMLTDMKEELMEDEDN